MDELAQPLRALLVVVQFQEAQFGGTDSGADKLVYVALVLGVEEQLSVLTDVLLELLLELDHVLQHQLLLWRVLTVGQTRALLLLELAATFELLVDNVLAALEELEQLVVDFGLHSK